MRRPPLGNRLKDNGQIDESIIVFRRVVALCPEVAEAHYNLGSTLRERGEYDAAIACFDRAIQLRQDFADARATRALVLMLQGDYRRGFAEYEWRSRTRPMLKLPPRNLNKPQWNGSELHGQTVFLHAEQGFGDIIQFIRYAPLVAQRGGKVIVGCQPELVRLVRAMSGIEQIITTGDPLPKFDLQCPIPSLPLAFATELNTVPAQAYFSPDAALVQTWKSKMGPSSGRLRIGLVWAGSPTNKIDRRRSMELSQLAPLASVEGIEFHSLQKGDAGGQSPPSGMTLIDRTGDIQDFADMAALIANLDLVITVDTAVAHLAGAMGKPLCVMLPFYPPWQWMLDRPDSPWYPTARLFRQKTPGDWGAVIDAVAAEASRLIN